MTPRSGSILTTVNELISPITGQWDLELVRDTFWLPDAELILKMPLRDSAVAFTACHYDSKDEHSVKQACKLQGIWLLLRKGLEGNRA